MLKRPRPTQVALKLIVQCLDGKMWDLEAQSPDNFTFIVFYRHQNCSLCKQQLTELQSLSNGFTSKGVGTIAISMDDAAGAEHMRSVSGLSPSQIGFGLELETAIGWGLNFSKQFKPTDPVLFTEPALYLVTPSNEIYFSSIQSSAFGRPDLEEILSWTEKIKTYNFQARGAVSYNEAREIWGRNG